MNALAPLLANLAQPPVMFFFLGMLAVAARSDLEVPQPLPKLFSLYLLVSIGFRGGVELRKSGLDTHMLATLGAAVAMSIVVPLYVFFVARRRLDVPNAAAVAATYGSISAVTFIAASSFLAQVGERASGHMVAATALMESPAILVGVVLARRYGSGPASPMRELVRDAMVNGSVFVLVGSLLIGALTGASGDKALSPFVGDIFKGMLCLFLLDMGIVSAQKVSALRAQGLVLPALGIVFALVNAAAGIAVSRALGLSHGDALLFTVLCASASYIAVPAAMRLALPDANPGVYVSMSLAVTFPFNVAIGIPLYMSVLRVVLR